MKKILSLLVLLVVLLAVTCPDKQVHKEAISNTVSNVIDDKMSEGIGENGGGLAVLGTMFASKIVDVFLDSKLRVKNYILFSLGEIHYEGKTKIVSIGFANHVFTYDEDDLKEAIDKQ